MHIDSYDNRIEMGASLANRHSPPFNRLLSGWLVPFRFAVSILRDTAAGEAVSEQRQERGDGDLPERNYVELPPVYLDKTSNRSYPDMGMRSRRRAQLVLQRRHDISERTPKSQTITLTRDFGSRQIQRLQV